MINDGPGTTYEWQKNGAPVGTNSPLFLSNTLVDGDIIVCGVPAYSATCGAPTLHMSNSIVVHVGPPVTPAVLISASATQSCTGTPVNFTAVATNGGTAPTYQWLLNGSATGSGPTYTSSTLQNGDVISCLLQADATTPCLLAPGAVSNSMLGKFNMPGAFTPNGDGKNDVFRIPPRTLFTLKELAVYDRWGARVFSTTNIGQGWDGTYSGHP